MNAQLVELARTAATSAQELPLIDLDGTVLVQFVIFLVTSIVLTQFLFKPFLAMMTARGEGIEGAHDEAIRADEEANAKLAQYDAALAKTLTTAAGERQKLRAEATNREREVVEAALAKTAASMARSRATLDADASKARGELAPRARELGRAIATRLLGREIA